MTSAVSSSALSVLEVEVEVEVVAVVDDVDVFTTSPALSGTLSVLSDVTVEVDEVEVVDAVNVADSCNGFVGVATGVDVIWVAVVDDDVVVVVVVVVVNVELSTDVSEAVVPVVAAVVDVLGVVVEAAWDFRLSTSCITSRSCLVAGKQAMKSAHTGSLAAASGVIASPRRMAHSTIDVSVNGSSNR